MQLPNVNSEKCYHCALVVVVVGVQAQHGLCNMAVGGYNTAQAQPSGGLIAGLRDIILLEGRSFVSVAAAVNFACSP